jgi:hypothetical protein
MTGGPTDAGERSGEQMARRQQPALAERLHTILTCLLGGHGGWGADRHEFARRLREALGD